MEKTEVKTIMGGINSFNATLEKAYEKGFRMVEGGLTSPQQNFLVAVLERVVEEPDKVITTEVMVDNTFSRHFLKGILVSFVVQIAKDNYLVSEVGQADIDKFLNTIKE